MFPRSVVLAVISLVVATATAYGNPRVIRVGLDAPYPPFSYFDEHNRLIGFEIDIANALCAELKAKCEFVLQQWDDIIPALLANRFDAIFSSMSITEERKKQIAFSKRYYQTPSSFTVRKASNIRDTSPAAMKGRVIGAQVDTIHVRYLQEVYAPAGASIRLYTSQQEVQLELARGHLDAMFSDKVGVYEWLEKSELGQCCQYAGQDVVDPAYLGEGVGIGLRKEDTELRERLDAAIDAILADGTYKKINEKYFPFSIY